MLLKLVLSWYITVAVVLPWTGDAYPHSDISLEQMEAWSGSDIADGIPVDTLTTIQIASQFSALASYCTSLPPQPSPCLQNWTDCASRLGEAPSDDKPAGPMYPPLTLGTRVLAKMSTYNTSTWSPAEGYIVANDDLKWIVVGFAGSTIAIDYWNDFTFTKSNYDAWHADSLQNIGQGIEVASSRPKLKVHRGFWLCYLGIREMAWNALGRVLEDKQYDDYQIIFTGHRWVDSRFVRSRANVVMIVVWAESWRRYWPWMSAPFK
jgi:hypothetical protein